MAGFGQSPPPFTNDEKNYMLAEVFKSLSRPFAHLLELCVRFDAQPRFEDLPSPPGRSANACKAVWEEMRRSAPYSPISHVGSAITVNPGPSSSLRRPSAMDNPYPTGRALAPKSTNYPYQASSIPEPSLKRKRGRPTKAEQQARAAEQAGESSSRGGRFHTPLSASMPPSPIVETGPSFRTMAGPSMPPSPRAPFTTLPPTTRVPISAIVSTPIAPAQATSHSSSSSGKRRRRRRSEEQAVQDGSGTSRYYAPAQEETPARPVVRRRDEPIHSSVARLGVSEPEQTTGAQQSFSPGPT